MYQDGVDVDVTLGPDGTPWFATSHTILHFLDGTWETLAPPAEWEPGAEVHGLAITADGTVWTGEGDTMLWSYDGARWTPHPGVVPEGMAGLVAAAPDGSLWAGMEQQLVRSDGEAWTTVPGPEGRDLGPAAPSFSPDGALWLVDVEAGGLLTFGDGSWTHHLEGVSIEDVAFAADGTVWAASSEEGAFRFDGATWTRYTTADGLDSDFLMSVAVTPDGAVWFGTLDSGVTRFDPES